MKAIAKIALMTAVTLPICITPVMGGTVDSVAPITIQADQAVEDAALYLSFTARSAKGYVESELDSKVTRFYHSKAVRLTRAMNILALDMASLAQQDTWDQEAVDSLFADIELTFFQIDSTKRTLARRYRSQARTVEDVFNDIRTAFYNMKLEIYGEI